MRKRLVQALAVITLTGILLVQVTPPQVVWADAGTPSATYEEVGERLDYWANRYNIPPAILKAVAWMESGWRQFDGSGQPLMGGDGVGIGIMQVSSYDPNNPEEVNRLKTDIDYNIERGAQLLNQKWRAYPKIGNGDRNVLENWYFAVWGYNGWNSVNNPNNPDGKQGMAYQDIVFDLLGQKYNSAITYVPGATKLPQESLPPVEPPSLETVWDTPQNAHPGDLNVDLTNLISAGGLNGDASGDYWYAYGNWGSYYALGFYVTAYNRSNDEDTNKASLERKITASYRNLLSAADELLANPGSSETQLRRAAKYYATVLKGPAVDQSLIDRAKQGLGQANVAAAKAQLGAGFDEAVTTAAKDLPKATDKETALGNWLADATRAAVSGTDFAFHQANFPATALAKGPVTRGQIYSLLPYDNTIVTLNMTGADILSALEQGVSGKNGLLSVSGLKYSWDPEQPEGKRILSAVSLSGSPIEAGKIYKVAVNDTLASGADGFSAFRKGTNVVNTRILVRDALLSDLKARPSISGDTDGRAIAKPKPKPQYVQVTATSLNMRTGPGTQYGTGGTLKKGATVELVSSTNGWAKIIYNGNTYYVSAQYVKQISTPAAPPTGQQGGSGGQQGSTGGQSSAKVMGQVTADKLNLRTGPGTGYGIAGSLTRGAQVEILSTANGWSQIKYNGNSYYVAAQYVKATTQVANPGTQQPAAPAAATAQVTASSLNLRTGPGTQYGIAGSLPRGTKVEIISSSGGWAKIKYNGNTYYASAVYVK